MIKFSHTIFALPFVLSAVVLAFREHSLGVMDIAWIIIAAVSARSAAMGFNRVKMSGLTGKIPGPKIVKFLPANCPWPLLFFL